VIAKLIAQPSDQASAGTVLATLVTPTKLVQLSLNEVDATKVKVDQKATLTFDAIPDLEIAGRVYEIDPLGAVSQGVVNYAVKVAFETQDERIKSGMSASVSIITDVRTDVIIVPNAGLRKVGNTTTVQTLSSIKTEPATDIQVQGVLADVPPESRVIEVGIANDQSTEIISGLAEGDQVIIRTIDPATAAAARTQPTGAAGIRIPGLGGGAGGGGNFARPAGR
jgi:Multidrug resistance efflux pump